MPHSRAMSRPAPESSGAWYRQPVLWLGAAILLASLAGCIWMIVLGARHADTPVETSSRAGVFGVPAHAHSSRGPAP
jgi:hypothetical protein